MKQAQRNKKGQFVKGNTLTSSGRPGGGKGLSKYIKVKTRNLEELIDEAYKMLLSSKTNNRDKIAIINLLLNRAIGTSIQEVHQTGGLDITIQAPSELDDI